MAPIPEGYEVVGELGRGTFGSVFLAKELALAGRLVAIKVSSQQLGESQTLARLQHPNIVPVYSIHKRGKYQVMVMPYLGSMTLAHLINDIRRSGELPHTGKRIVSTLLWNSQDPNQAGTVLPKTYYPSLGPATEPIPIDHPIESLPAEPTSNHNRPLLNRLEKMNFVDSVLWLGAELAGGLAHAHERGIMHRDIKPANVLISDDGTPMLLDFNMADDIRGRSDERETLGGTLRYMSPEQLAVVRDQRGSIDPRSDIYSLGAILYETISGRLPYPEISPETHWSDDQVYAERLKVPPVLSELNSEVSPAIASILAKCLMPTPAHRYSSASDLREDLMRQLEHRPLKFAHERSYRERFNKWTIRHPRLASSLVVSLYAMIAIASVSIFFFYRQQSLAVIEAEQARDRLFATRTEVQAAMSTSIAPTAQFQDVIERVSQTLTPYDVEQNSSKWLHSRRVSKLSPEDQIQVREQASELMFQAAEANFVLSQRFQKIDPYRYLNEALRWNDIVCSSWPEGIPVNFLAQRARFLKEMGRDSEAKEAARQASQGVQLQLSPMLEALARVRGGSVNDEAITELKKQSLSNPPRYDVWVALGSAYYQRGLYDSALEAYDGAIALNPEFPWTYFHRGMVALQLKRFPSAIENFTRVIELREDEPENYLNRAIARLGLSDFEGAISDLDAVEARGAKFTRLYFLRSRARQALKDTEGAARDRAKGFETMPEDAISWLSRAEYRLKEAAVDLEKVLADIDMAITLDPKFIAAYERKGEVLAERKQDLEGALLCFNKILEIHPSKQEVLPAKAVILARMGRKKESRDILNILRTYQKTPVLCYQLASAYLRLDETPADRDYAVELLKQALQGNVQLAHLMPNDSDLEAIRDREDFRKYLDSALVLIGRR